MFEYLSQAYAWLMSEAGAQMLLALFAVSEFLGGFESVKSNSVYQAFKSALSYAMEKLGVKKESDKLE